MTTTRTTRRTRNVLAIAAGLALAVVPAAAAVHTPESALAVTGGSLVADTTTVTPAPPVADPATSGVGDVEAAQPLAKSTGLDTADSSSTEAEAAQAGAVSVPTDDAGSTEARTVKRSCGAAPDSHYVPSQGSDSSQCYDNEGKFQPSRKYTATHYTNDVDCGGGSLISGSGTYHYVYVVPGTDSGYAGGCSDGIVGVHGRAMVSADADGSARVVWDGDRDNPEETTQGWADATVSAEGPEYRCGESYDEGGRGTADAPTSADSPDNCTP